MKGSLIQRRSKSSPRFNARPAQLPFVENGLAPVLLALPTYNWGYVSVQRIVDKVHLKQDVPTIIPPMEVILVTTRTTSARGLASSKPGGPRFRIIT